jgi:hypothetical protein
MLQAERLADYLQSKLPQASEVTVENVFRIPAGASRKAWSFDTLWRQGGGIAEQSVIRSACADGIDRLG